MQDSLRLVDVLDETLHATGERKVFFLGGALVDQPDAHAVVEERKLAQPLAEHFVVEVDHAEDRVVRQEVHLGAALVSGAGDLHRRDLDRAVWAINALRQAVLHDTLAELERMHLAIAADREPQPFAERVDARHADAMQAAGDLVAVLVELAAGVQLGQRDLGGRAPGLVLVVELDAGGNAATVVDHGDRVVGVNRDDDVVAVAGQRLVD